MRPWYSQRNRDEMPARELLDVDVLYSPSIFAAIHLDVLTCSHICVRMSAAIPIPSDSPCAMQAECPHSQMSGEKVRRYRARWPDLCEAVAALHQSESLSHAAMMKAASWSGPVS